MKKIISQWKFDKLFEQSYDGLGKKKENGYFEFSANGVDEWFKRLDKLNEEYIVVGPRIINNLFRDLFHIHKLRHLNLGKIHYKDKDIDNNNFEITDIPRELTYNLCNYLSVIIRDYLRKFNECSPIIGNCVVNEEDSEKKWADLLNKTADEFDRLHTNYLSNKVDSIKYSELTKQAFKDLEFIFNDLNW